MSETATNDATMVVGDIPTVPPSWALSQRYLIASMNEAAVRFVERYTWRDGEFVWRDAWPGMDGSDDAYESYGNFPLFYMLGGGEEVHQLSRRLWTAVTRQFTRYGQVHNEFDAYYDWMHHGESYTYIYFFGLADPTVRRDADRALRFAGMYMGDDPEADNYDPTLKLIRSPITGSRGPRFENTIEDWTTHRPVLDNYPPPFEDIPGAPGPKCQWTDDRIMGEIITRMNARMMKGDVPLNMAATSLITNAYLYTGDDKYKQWVLDYTAAWRERAEANGGLVPDNVGLSGRIGECMDGKWWGGYYGYRWPHGILNAMEGCMIAGSNAFLLTGDAQWLEFPRSQLDFIGHLGRVEDGRLVVPHRHGDSGWYDYRPMDPTLHTHLWYLSQDEADMERLRGLAPGESWDSVTDGRGKGDNLHAAPWLRYVTGSLPSYPDDILGVAYREHQRRLEAMRADDGDPHEWDVHHWQQLNPVGTEALVNLSLGAPQHVYHGGLLHCRVRYFDAARRRPGLPDDVGALVSAMTPDRTTVELVNTNTMEARELVVRAGAFAEHKLTTIRWSSRGPDGSAPVAHEQAIGSADLPVRLEPGCGVKLDLPMRRHVNRPTYAFPWHAGSVPIG